jgi:predicted kinase
MARLLILRGLPGSGKTTFARTLQPLVTRVSRDDLRLMLHGRIMLTGWAEAQVTAVQRGIVETLLRRGADVVADDTNLRPRTVRDLRSLAESCGAAVELHDFTDVPLDECIRRDALRPADVRVGAAAIQRMYDRYLARRG